MAIWPFNRRKKSYNPNLPPEVQAYSQAANREKMGMAWLVGIMSLAATALIITALFFGGRWVYRKIAGTDKPNTSTTQQVDENEDEQAQKEEDARRDEEAKKADEARKAEEARAAEEQRKKEEATRAANQPSNPSNPQIPRTGPELDL